MDDYMLSILTHIFRYSWISSFVLYYFCLCGIPCICVGVSLSIPQDSSGRRPIRARLLNESCLDGAQMERVLSEELHVTNQDWARLPASQTIFCRFKEPQRLCGNGKAWWGPSEKVGNYWGWYCFGWCPARYAVINQESRWKPLWDSLYCMMEINNWLIHPGVNYNITKASHGSRGLLVFNVAVLSAISCPSLYIPFLTVVICALLRASTHIKWRAAVRFQFRTHLRCCRPPTRSAVAEGTQGSPITALYANVLAPGQQRGHAGTGSLFMQISGRQSQRNTEPATDTAGHISPAARLVGETWKTWKMWTKW